MEQLGIAYEDYGDLERRVDELRERYTADDPLKRVSTFATSDEMRDKILKLGTEDQTQDDEDVSDEDADAADEETEDAA